MDPNNPVGNDPSSMATTGNQEAERISSARILHRPTVRGKFLYRGEQKLWIRGTTYGTFRPDPKGFQFPAPEVVDEDFRRMARSGLNAIRTYTLPPLWLLDTAQEHGLSVMIGLSWAQEVTFLDDAVRKRDIAEKVRIEARSYAGHPAVLCYALGNEIPASIVRWHGRHKIERFIHSLYRIVKEEDPEGLATYVNFPTTEYLQLPFLDFVCFNVYLESRDNYESYLSRLQNSSGERPLVMAEIGLDSRTNGELAQARSLDWQVRSAFAGGCAGTFVFAWTDEWYRGGFEVEDWDFGLTTRERGTKPALHAIKRAYKECPAAPGPDWPKITVAVCTLNGSATIRDTLEGLKTLAYPDFEVIIVNDGSTDATVSIVREYDVALISTENRGLSSARNTALSAARGEIIAYIDDDAYPDPDWLTYLALTYIKTSHVGVGGPNLAPAGDGRIADCVANSPGGPVHVLFTDTLAEHIPGCNMSFRTEALRAIGGFDPRYRAAGDDVDACWRIQDSGWTIGFHPSAMVWHHRRNSLRMYWKQQLGYGKAEALLEEKWPERYNRLGHISWGGRLYGKGLTLGLHALGGRVYQGVWGSAPFQSLYQQAPTMLLSLPLTPEWYFLVALLGTGSLLGLLWPPLLVTVPATLLAIALPLLQAVLSARSAHFTSEPRGLVQKFGLFATTAVLHLVQPLARLIGRIRHGLTPWRRRSSAGRAYPWPQKLGFWREQWEAPESTLQRIQRALRQVGTVTPPGGPYDRWDLDIRGGLMGSARLRMAIEEHGSGRQQVRFRIWPHANPLPLAIIVTLVLLGSVLTLNGDLLALIPLGLAALLGGRTLFECSAALGLGKHVLDELSAQSDQ